MWLGPPYKLQIQGKKYGNYRDCDSMCVDVRAINYIAPVRRRAPEALVGEVLRDGKVRPRGESPELEADVLSMENLIRGD